MPTPLEQLLALPTQPTLWWTAADATVEGGVVTAVAAHGDTTIAISQPTEADRPAYIASEPLLSGRPCWHIDASNKHLEEVGSGALGTLTNWRLYWVCVGRTPGAGGKYEATFFAHAGVPQVYTSNNTTGARGFYDGTAHRTVAGNTGGPQVNAIVFDAVAGKAQHRQNRENLGSLVDYDGDWAVAGATKIQSGFNSGTQGTGTKYAEYLLFTGDIGAEAIANEIAVVEAYLADHYGLSDAYLPDSSPEQVFVAFGQSNMMAGWNYHASGTQSAAALADPRIVGWDSTPGRWEQADGDTPGDLQGNIGQVSASFAHEVITRGDLQSVGFISHAKASTAIADLLPGQTRYTELIAAVTASGATISGVFWWQGEADTGRTKEDHLADLETLRTGLRTDLGNPPIYAFDLFGDELSCGSFGGVRAALAQWAADHEDVTLITTSDLVNTFCHAPWTGGYEIAGQRLRAAVFG